MAHKNLKLNIGIKARLLIKINEILKVSIIYICILYLSK